MPKLRFLKTVASFTTILLIFNYVKVKQLIYKYNIHSMYEIYSFSILKKLVNIVNNIKLILYLFFFSKLFLQLSRNICLF